MTDEQRAKCSVAQKEAQNRPGVRAAWAVSGKRKRWVAALKAKANRPEARERNSATVKKWWNTPGVKEKMSEIQKELQSHPEERAKRATAVKAGWTSEAKERVTGSLSPNYRGGPRLSRSRSDAKRRGLGHVYLNNWLDGGEGHHVDNEQVIYMPKELHKSVFHRQTDGRGMAKINAIAYNFLFKQEVDAAMATREGT